MSRYVLDTTALIDLSKGREPARSWIPAVMESDDELAVCAVNIAEFFAGLPPDRRATWDQFFAALPCWPISPGAARQAGIWRYDFARRGVTLSLPDTLIAAVAGEYSATIVTSNAKDYPMEGLALLVWDR